MQATETPPASGWLGRLEAIFMSVSALAMMAIMLIVVADVFGRYALSSPLSWSYDMIGLYMMVAVFFLALPDTLTHHSHIAVDVFQPMLPARLKHLSLSLGYAAAACVVALIGWGGWLRFSSAWANDDRIASTVALPTWVPYAMVTIGSAVMTLRCLVRVWGHGTALITGTVTPGLEPAPPRADEDGGV
ncbi:TRAP-type C4-dicarboxylate transport system, small permease component [Gemmobacter megaterium]|uniref:TRAP transporter small permease protein n=1 Tax=Gemmobacter megaterium TaxID=1086013 RepID=A0A1N7Q5A2_9RHOB|nr:TRAP transporter small permease [Gemmobacter megaterium]GGE23179.1 C4-dicarboxylate ABC transporter permease [Gemmobacter megaterium]SIT18011.1 TRAP-type C4-dicarboxylate transport system, small permease component [Gemmobacter megaterium]